MLMKHSLNGGQTVKNNLDSITKYIFELVKNGNMAKEMAFEILKELKKGAENNDVAIIGMSCKFPGAENIDQYWRNILEGKSSIGCFPDTRRHDTDVFLTEQQKLKEDPYFKGGYLKEIDKFDEEFFEISPKEADLMDPYQRIFLETALEAIEDSGYCADKLKGTKTGVFAGTDHTHKYKFSYINLIEEPDYMAITGSWTGILASRISHLLNLTGQSLVIDTGCSSSMVALHTACKSLKNKDCSMAIVGGINLLMYPLAESSMLGVVETDQAEIRPFDKDAKGTIWGEGCASIVIKPLNKAIMDRDNIYAVIKGTAVNHNGYSNGITSLKAEAHKDVILSAWNEADLNPETIKYIEAHGTGTLLGDSIEASGLNSAFKVHTNKNHICGIGSVKANIGHLVAASGMASLIKVVLMSKYRIIPKNINYSEPNPYINFDNNAVYVVDKQMNIESSEVFRAGVCSYGFSGTNCHIVLEEAPKRPVKANTKAGQKELFTMSCKSEELLKQLLQKYSLFLSNESIPEFEDICYTANTGRGHYFCRLAIIADSIEQLKEKIALTINEDITALQEQDIYFGIHYIVPESKKSKAQNEITEGTRRQITRDINDEISKLLIDESQYESLLKKICDAYITGADVNWELLYKNSERNRVSLPVYPLARRRHWVDTESLARKRNEQLQNQLTTNSQQLKIMAQKNSQRNFSVIEDVISDVTAFHTKNELMAMEAIKSESVVNVIDDINKYACLRLLKTFQNMGVFIKADEVYNHDKLLGDLRIAEYYYRFFEAILSILETNGFIEIKEEAITCTAALQLEDVKHFMAQPDNEKEKMKMLHPEMRSYFDLLDKCIGNYDKILTGDTLAVSVMFENNNTDMVGDIYQGSTASNYFNKLVAICIKSYIEKKINSVDDGNKIKILEVGAGTGGTSVAVFEEIEKFSENIEYYYTDISLSFASHGSNTFGEKYKFAKFGILNIEKDIEEQGFKVGEFDIVMAANVIHGTRNLKNTINQVKKMLRTNGLFVLNEITQEQAFSTLTFGLLPGWWLFEDEELRIKNSPLLSDKHWESLLLDCGFRHVNEFHGMNADGTNSVVSVIAAESDGVYLTQLHDKADNTVNEMVQFNGNIKEVILEGKPDNSYTDLERNVAMIWAESLGLTVIDIYKNFFQLGGDSIIAIKIVGAVSVNIDTSLNLTEVLNHPTVAEFCEYIQHNYIDVNKHMYHPIEKAPEMINYPLSMAQKRLFIINQFVGVNESYNIPYLIEIRGDISKEQVENTFNKIVERHEALRTSFCFIDGQPIQRVEEHINFKVDFYQIDETEVTQLANKLVYPFDLSKAPLLRVSLIKISDFRHILFFDMHHIISDASSISIMLTEFIQLLNNINNNYELPKLTIQYKDFAVWQNSLLSNIKKQEEYWVNRFSDEIPLLDMPYDYLRPKTQNFEGDSIIFEFPKELTLKLRDICSTYDTTMYMLLLSVYNIILSKYSGQEDIIVGSVIEGRNHPDLKNIIGMFVNTLAMRNQPNGDKHFNAFLKEVKQNALDAYDNQDYQFDELIEKLNIHRNASRNPLFDVVFSLHNMNIPVLEVGNLTLMPYEYKVNVAKFDMSLYAEEKNDTISFNLEYCTKLFKNETMEKFIEHFTAIAHQIAEDPNIKLKDITLLSDAESRFILTELNETEAKFDDDVTINKLFEQQVKRTPNNIALVFKEEKYTYRQLNSMANKVANYLKNNGIKEENIVAILAENSIDMIVAILGVLKAGGAYLPIDPAYPSLRIKHMLEESNAQILLMQRDFSEAQEINCSKELISNIISSQESSGNVKCNTNSRNLCYVIYTSGSTGTPNGVMVEHKALINLCSWHNRNFKVTEKDRATKYAGVGFDASVWEIFPYIICGASIYIIENEHKLDMQALNKYYEDNDITISFLPTQVCEQFMEYDNNSLRILLTGGDRLKCYTKRNYQLFNNYGPTENTVVTTCYLMDGENDKILIGKPISNSKVYVLDKYMNTQTIGIPGELYISGESLARGYIKRDEFTKERFVPNPFALGTVMYKTGDLVRWVEGGYLEFIGRVDHQVKIRGYRIELNEIEANLLEYDDIKEAVVTDYSTDDGDRHLCAYVTGKDLNIDKIRDYLALKLPDYMIPAYFVALDKMPITPNGKIDRKALSNNKPNMLSSKVFEAPKSDIEIKLATLWEELLSVEQVGINDNFFELGGHSLKVTIFAEKVREYFKVNLPINEVFTKPTIKELAKCIESAEKIITEEQAENFVLIKKGQSSDKNIYFIHAGDGGVEAYMELSNMLNGDYNYWGIKCDEFEHFAPINISAQEVASEYINKLLLVQPKGPYYIAGWSVGGVIAFEMVLQLERMGKEVALFTVIDSYAPQRQLWKEIDLFTLESERQFLLTQMNAIDIKEKLLSAQSIRQLWDNYVDYLVKVNLDINIIRNGFPNDVKRSIPNFEQLSLRELIYYYNLLRTFNNLQALYIPDGIVKTKMHYIRAKSSEISNELIWNKYCTDLVFYDIEGTHYSIFEEGNVGQLVDCFKEIVGEINL